MLCVKQGENDKWDFYIRGEQRKMESKPCM